MTDRFLCIHGHFYQPPRENPWLEAIEIQDEAYPYHDWNELITAECYAPNALSRILDSKGRIRDIVSNYAKISFDMGPTLLSWLEKNASDAYEAVLEADSQSLEWRSGHGAAMAQCYNHMIMSLASPRDKLTQVLWGIRDFRMRFGRDPEGMWLPETAVDLETLDIMAGEGIAFTVLAQHQAKVVRPGGGAESSDVSDGSIDPSKPYLLTLPSGRRISLFFYDGSVSQAVAFEGLLKSGENFASRLMGGFSKKREHPQLMHIATDGESYGHHHKFGDMALAYALHSIEKKENARLTNYGEFLAKHPPEDEVEIIEDTAWSCYHGIERWKSDCGCSTGANPGWNQAWRAPLREALDWLRNEATALYELGTSELFKDHWKTRDAYVDVIVDRSEKGTDAFLSEHAGSGLEASRRTEALALLELERHAMLMYTSCGWFFDDISGIEAVQVLRYAGRVIQLARFLFGKDLEKEFLEKLGDASSNDPSKGTGADIYMKSVRPHIVTLEKVAAHYAISSLFEDYTEDTGIFCYRIHSLDYRKLQAAKSSLVVGLCEVTSEITLRSVEVSFAVLHLGDHDFSCGVRTPKDFDAYTDMASELTEAFDSGAFADVVRLIDKHFGTTRFTLFDLFRDEQRHILDTLIKETMDGFEDSYRRIYDENRILMGFLKDTDVPVPRAFLTAAEFTLNLDLKRLLMGKAEAGEVGGIMEEFERWDIMPNKVDLEFAFRRTLEREAALLEEDPTDLQKLMNMDRLMEIALSLPFTLNLWKMQNIYFRMVTTAYGSIRTEDVEYHTLWDKAFRSLGEKLYFNMKAVMALAGGSDV